jgi:hypothetical protein
MKKVFLSATLLIASMVIFVACQKTKDVAPADEISQDVLQKIKTLGFGTTGVVKVEEGYIVERDIVLTNELLNSVPSQSLLVIANNEQYRTTNVVTHLPRTITVKIVSLTQPFSDGLAIAVSQYNALNLSIKFQQVTGNTKADIEVRGFNQPPSGGYITLGSSGFPTRQGDPYGTVKMNTNVYAYGTNPDPQYVGAVLLHEIGHCIGFRHTDYANRAYSCGGSPTNEGASNVGAVWIPGTPTGPDANSWMLACSDGTNRTFNNNDKTALNYLY